MACTNIRRLLAIGYLSAADSVLVAPVKIGDGAYIAAGSAITENVPPNALGIARSRQSTKPGWAAKKRRETAGSHHPKKSAKRKLAPRNRVPAANVNSRLPSPESLSSLVRMLSFAVRQQRSFLRGQLAQLDSRHSWRDLRHCRACARRNHGFDLALIGASLVAGGIVGLVFGSANIGLLSTAILAFLYFALFRKWLKSKLQSRRKRRTWTQSSAAPAYVTKRIAPRDCGLVKIAPKNGAPNSRSRWLRTGTWRGNKSFVRRRRNSQSGVNQYGWSRSIFHDSSGRVRCFCADHHRAGSPHRQAI